MDRKIECFIKEFKMFGIIHRDVFEWCQLLATLLIRDLHDFNFYLLLFVTHRTGKHTIGIFELSILNNYATRHAKPNNYGIRK